MNHLILDAGIVALACLPNTEPTNKVDSLIQKVSGSSIKRWLYAAQVSEILEQIRCRLTDSDSPDSLKKARELLEKFSQQCFWLSALSEDVSLQDDDPIRAGLVQATSRLGKGAMVVSDVKSRLSYGLPFVSVQEVLDTVMSDNKVQFIELSAQQDGIRPALERNIHRVLYHGQYVMGPEITTLESRLATYVGVDHCVCVSSGTDALLIAMMALEISPGDEVITTPFTFFAAIETIKLLGAKPIFVDIDQTSYALDANLIEAAINGRTKAILPVSLYGQCGDMDRINEIADSHQIPVIEDGAQSFGATYRGRRSCSLSQIGCTSFFPAKPLGAYGDAGACFTQDPQLAVRIREIRDHGQSARYEHVRMGVNGRMDTLQAAVLLAKLDIFDEELVSRAQVAEQYAEILKPAEKSGLLTLPKLKPYNFSSWAQYTIEVNQRNRVQNSMAEKGIPTAVHYPQPVYKQLALTDSVTHCPVTDRVVERVLSLPMHPYLSVETQERVAGSLNQALNS